MSCIIEAYNLLGHVTYTAPRPRDPSLPTVRDLGGSACELPKRCATFEPSKYLVDLLSTALCAHYHIFGSPAPPTSFQFRIPSAHSYHEEGNHHVGCIGLPWSTIILTWSHQAGHLEEYIRDLAVDELEKRMRSQETVSRVQFAHGSVDNAHVKHEGHEDAFH